MGTFKRDPHGPFDIALFLVAIFKPDNAENNMDIIETISKKGTDKERIAKKVIGINGSPAPLVLIEEME